MSQIPAAKRPVEYVIQRPAAPGVNDAAGRSPSTQRAFAHVMTEQTAAHTPSASEQSASDQVGVSWGDAPSGTPEYKFDFGPSSLDPGSMAFLLAWMGGSPDHKSLQTQQQEYLTYYRQQHPDGVAGVNSYTTSATDYTTGKA